MNLHLPGEWVEEQCFLFLLEGESDEVSTVEGGGGWGWGFGVVFSIIIHSFMTEVVVPFGNL